MKREKRNENQCQIHENVLSVVEPVEGRIFNLVYELTVELCLHGELWHFAKLIWQRSHFGEGQSLEVS